MTEQARTIIVENNPIYRAGVRATLEGNVEIVSELRLLTELTEDLISSTKPTVLLVGLSAKDSVSLSFVSELHSNSEALSIVVLGAISEEFFASRVIRAGGVSYLNYSCAPEDLVGAVLAAHEGKVFLTAGGSSSLASQLQSRSTKSAHSQLSDREYQIFLHICRGTPLVKIADEFKISVKTVSTYRSRILKKMGMQTNAELIQYAVRNSIVSTVSA